MSLPKKVILVNMDFLPALLLPKYSFTNTYCSFIRFSVAVVFFLKEFTFVPVSLNYSIIPAPAIISFVKKIYMFNNA
jgi:hypothetical protein